MPTTPESWLPEAQALGYKTEEEMLRDLYVTRGLSISQLVSIIGYAKNSIRRRLIQYGIPFRGKGGKNNLGHGALVKVSDEDLLGDTMEKLAARYNVHPSTIYNERRRRGLKCVSVPLPQPTAQNGTVVSPEATSSSPSGPLDLESILNTLDEQQNEETTSSSTTEPGRES